MAKHAPALLDDPPPVRLGRRMRGLIVIGLILAVPAFEEGKVICARWMTMFGHPSHARTPILDLIGAHGRRIWAACSGRVEPMLRDPPWEFGPTIGIATAWMLAMVLLMRGMRR